VTLRGFIESGKKIIITTVQKFPFILDEIGTSSAGGALRIFIDEAHSSQGGKTLGRALHGALGGRRGGDDETTEDKINRVMEARKLLPNASYFAFTATPKNKTLEIFGVADEEGGQVKHRPFDSYTMKQAIQEGFILDVLKHYTTGRELLQAHQEGGRRSGVRHQAGEEEAPPLRREPRPRDPAQGRDHGDHFHEQVLALNKIGGQARAMVVTSGVERAIQYYHAIRGYLVERKSRYQAIVASRASTSTAARRSLRRRSTVSVSQIADKIQEDPYRFLICADKFQTGYDEPLLHTMYVDKMLSGIKAVQTLSRLNRAHPQKHDVFVLDFMNDATPSRGVRRLLPHDDPREETDPNKLHDLQAALDGYQVTPSTDRRLLRSTSTGRIAIARPDPRRCVAVYKEHSMRTGRWTFKGKAKAFRAPTAFSRNPAVHECRVGEAVDLSDFLVPKLPAPSRRTFRRASSKPSTWTAIASRSRPRRDPAPDADAEIEPVPTTAAAQAGAGADPLSNISRPSTISSGTSMDRRRPGAQADHRGHSRSRLRGHRYQNAKKNSTGRTRASTRQGARPRDCYA
jgi:type I restriction enzyme R subunit